MSTSKSLFIKICGITNMEDASFVCSLGANAVGFVAYKESQRFISCAAVNKIISGLVQKFPEVKFVGVFVNSSYKTIMDYIDSGINVIQFHGDEAIEYIEDLRKTIQKNFQKDIELWRAIRLKGEEDIFVSKAYPVEKFLVDSFKEDEFGGTGVPGNWGLSKIAVEALNKPVILAGGLTPHNIASAIEIVRPFGVDISSGVEDSPGNKNHALLEQLFDEINLKRSS